jgi:hypothetical protein
MEHQFGKQKMQIEKCENQHFNQLNQHKGRVAEWLKASDSKSF